VLSHRHPDDQHGWLGPNANGPVWEATRWQPYPGCFRHAKIPWEFLRQLSLGVILRQYAMTHGVLVVDDADKKRCQVTTRIFKASTLYDKTSGGYLNGQTMVWLRWVTPANHPAPPRAPFDMPDSRPDSLEQSGHTTQNSREFPLNKRPPKTIQESR